MSVINLALLLLEVPREIARRHGYATRGRVSLSSRERASSDAGPSACGATLLKQRMSEGSPVQRSQGVQSDPSQLFTEAVAKAMTGIARLSHSKASSWSATDFASSLALCQDDVLPAITLFQRASKASTSDDERVGSAFGLVACNLLLSLQHADARDAASAAADALRKLCQALGSPPCPGGIQPHFHVHPGANPREPSCQGAVLSCLTHALACWYRSCSSSNSSSALVAEACSKEAHAGLGQVLDMLLRALGPTNATARRSVAAAAGEGLHSPAADGGGCTPSAALGPEPLDAASEQLLVVIEQVRVRCAEHRRCRMRTWHAPDSFLDTSYVALTFAVAVV